MHETHLKVASLLVLVIGAEFAKTNTSFLTCFFCTQNDSLSSAFSYYS